MGTTKYPVSLPTVAQPAQGTPVVYIPGEQMDAVTTPMDLATADQDPEISLAQNLKSNENPLDLPLNELVSQVKSGNMTTSAENSGAFSELVHFLRDTVIGNIILVTAAAALIIYLAVKIHNWESNESSLQTKIQTPGGLSTSQALAARQQLDTHMSDTAGLLAASGVAPADVTAISNIAKLTEGSAIAAAARQYDTAHSAFRIASSKPIVVIGAGGPEHYAGLNSMNMNGYLETLSKNPTPNTITENSAVMHGLETKNR